MNDLTARSDIEHVREVLEMFDEFIEAMPARFDRRRFKVLRHSSYSQWDWATAANVSQGTIGNWERGDTSPQGYYRANLRRAAVSLRDHFEEHATDSLRHVGTLFDPVKTDRQLRNSILTAALTDFELAEDGKQIIPIAFGADTQDQAAEEFDKDKRNLIESLEAQANAILEELDHGANVPTDKLRRGFDRYLQATKEDEVNPRLLNRFGQTLIRAANEEDTLSALSTIDQEALQGFRNDHLELMRLYFREALAKAQEVEATEIDADAELDDGSQFNEVADILEQAKGDSGAPLVSRSISTLLRDIANEMRDLTEAIAFTMDLTRRSILQRRKVEAFKSGSIYVGRFVFFGALIVAVGAGEVVGSIAGVVTLMETIAPGTIRGKYESLRERFPILPKLPEKPD
ncbi:hypothetical protein [Tateyamaria omphalii]|uniref:Uncharacterized protein n=1 Tax=Tateyamaria omphalii TaxID=299262 RepID=A0A1P8MQS4_9RHOB|nr:hypothetical protein [Tateyamaria omphalii]APX10329.1 hypothetical protein BWR18_00385 [Tateyamaria omphalii]